jgi:hypothetical protein
VPPVIVAAYVRGVDTSATGGCESVVGGGSSTIVVERLAPKPRVAPVEFVALPVALPGESRAAVVPLWSLRALSGRASVAEAAPTVIGDVLVPGWSVVISW